MTSPFFAFLHRMRYIQRWGLMRNTETENILEHSMDVAFIAHNLALLQNAYSEDKVDANKVAVMAMYHEVSEIFTGDMPTPIKYFDPQLRKMYGAVEQLASQKMLHTLPDALQDAYEPFITGAENEPEWPLVKAADTLAAFIKCVYEVHAGNAEFQEAHNSIKRKLKAMHIDAVDRFMTLYIEPLTESLDQLHYYDMGQKK